MAEGIALGRLGTDVQQAHPGLLHPHEPLGVKIAQIRKLQQIFRRTVGVGAAVAEQSAARSGGEYRPHGRPANTPDALDQQGGPRQQRAGGTGGDEGVSLPVFQHGQAHGQGGILFALEGSGGIVAHFHHFRSVHDLHALRQGAGQAGPDGLLTAHQHDVRAALGMGLQSALYHRLRGVVAAHSVQNDLHWQVSPFRGTAAVQFPGRRVYSSVLRAVRLKYPPFSPPGWPAPAGRSRRFYFSCP